MDFGTASAHTMPSFSERVDGDSFWDHLQTAVDETSTWVASTWTAWGASGGEHVGHSETKHQATLLTKGNPATKTALRTALSSRSISYVPQGDVEPFSSPKSEQKENDNTSKSFKLPVKFTFIHFDEREHLGRDQPLGMVRQSSAPCVLCNVPFREKLSSMERHHWKGNCKPCAYFHNKADSCRRGADCEFCHICRPEELKRQKRAKKKALRIAHEGRRALWGRKSRGTGFSQTWSECVDPSAGSRPLFDTIAAL